MENNINTNTKKIGKIAKFLTPGNCFWLTLTHIIMVVAAVVLVCGLIICVIDAEWEDLLYYVGSFVGALLICAPIQLLVKIEENTRK